MKTLSISPLAGIDHTSIRDDALLPHGDERRTYVRDALNVDISVAGRASMRPGLRQATATTYSDLWQSPSHGLFGRLGGQWVKIDPANWGHAVLAEIGEAPLAHLQLNNRVVAAGRDGLFESDGTTARRMALDVPAPPIVTSGSGSLPEGAYGVAVAWLRGAQESPTSSITHAHVPAAGSLEVILPLVTDPTVTGARMYLTRTNGGELLRGEDFPPGTSSVSLPVLPGLGATAQFHGAGAMPTGKFLSYWRGRLLVAQGNVLRFSQALAYHVHDARHDFIQLPQRVTFVAPLDGGIWVGQSDHVLFLAGNSPGELDISIKGGRRPVPGSAVILSAENSGDTGGDQSVAWLAENGYVTGTTNGAIIEHHAGRLSRISGDSGASVMFAKRLLTSVL